MENNRLMGMRFKTMLVLLIAVIVLHIQMRMRWRPLERHKGGKQNVNKCCAGTLLDHVDIEFGAAYGFAMPAARLYTCG